MSIKITAHMRNIMEKGKSTSEYIDTFFDDLLVGTLYKVQPAYGLGLDEIRKYPYFQNPDSYLPKHIHLTIEFDEKDFLSDQLSLFIGQRPKIEELVTAIRQRFRDIMGFCATYSGNRSIHYHFAVSTAEVASASGTNYRALYAQAWQRLEPVFIKELTKLLPNTPKSDACMRSLVQKRRIPSGSREDGKLQSLCWEKVFKRSARGATAALLDAIDLDRREAQRPPAQPIYDRELEDRMTAVINETFPSYPKLDRIEWNPLKAYFFNSESDRNPASLIFANSDAISVNGGKIDRSLGHLPVSLGDLASALSQSGSSTDVRPTPFGRMLNPIEKDFADKAIDHSTARSAIGDVLQPLTKGKNLLCAAEGLGKTTYLIKHLPDIMVNSGKVLFSFHSYEAVDEKIGEIKVAHPTLDVVKVKGYTRLIQEWVQEDWRIGLLFGQVDSRSYAKTVQQKGLYDQLKQRVRDEIGVITGDFTIVTVHAVMERFRSDGAAYKLYSDALGASQCVGLRIVDEISTGLLLDIKTSKQMHEVPEEDRLSYTRIGGDHVLYPNEWYEWIESQNNDSFRFIRTKKWVCDKVDTLLLTAEAAQASIARNLQYNVIELETPNIEADRPETYLLPVKADTIAEGIISAQTNYPRHQIISNVHTNQGIVNHMKAKGSNGFVGKDIVSLYLPPSPARIAELAIISDHIRDPDLIAKALLDDLNQTLGRNLGFRQSGKHVVQMNPKVYTIIKDHLAANRYGLDIQLTAGQRKEKKRSR